MVKLDHINGLFELASGVLMWLNVKALINDGQLKGVKIAPALVFTLWGYFNLFYYPSLHQWWSLVGGCLLVLANTIWIGIALLFWWDDRKWDRKIAEQLDRLRGGL